MMGKLRVRFNIWFVPIGAVVAGVGTLGTTEIEKGNAMGWFGVALLISTLLFCVSQCILWFIKEKPNDK